MLGSSLSSDWCDESCSVHDAVCVQHLQKWSSKDEGEGKVRARGREEEEERGKREAQTLSICCAPGQIHAPGPFCPVISEHSISTRISL